MPTTLWPKFYNNLSINIVQPYNVNADAIKLDPTHPLIDELKILANANPLDNHKDVIGPLTITDGVDWEIMEIWQYDAPTDQFFINRRQSSADSVGAIGETFIDWATKSGVHVEMRITAQTINDLYARLRSIWPAPPAA